jgi:hypothetical protein
MRYVGVCTAASSSDVSTLYPCNRLRESIAVKSGTRIPRCVRSTYGRSGVVVALMIDSDSHCCRQIGWRESRENVWSPECGQEIGNLECVCSLRAVASTMIRTQRAGGSSATKRMLGFALLFRGLKNDRSDDLSLIGCRPWFLYDIYKCMPVVIELFVLRCVRRLLPPYMDFLLLLGRRNSRDQWSIPGASLGWIPRLSFRQRLKFQPTTGSIANRPSNLSCIMVNRDHF